MAAVLRPFVGNQGCLALVCLDWRNRYLSSWSSSDARRAATRSDYVKLARFCCLAISLLASEFLLGGPTALVAAGLPRAAPRDVGMDDQQLARIDEIVVEGLAEKRMPGCVVCVGRRGKIVMLKAYGKKQLQPDEQPMTTDTVFDMASITKPVATATSVMLLVERGQLKLGQRVSSIIPEFAANEKDQITIFDLLTHQSGLLPDNAVSDYEHGREEAIKTICELKL